MALAFRPAARGVLALTVAVLIGLVVAASARAATLAVTSAGDPDNGLGSCSTGGACSLREAVNQADADKTGDVISLPAGTYTLDSKLGPLAFTGSVTVTGSGTSGTIISGGGMTQILTVASPATVSIGSVTLEDGDAMSGDGGAALVNAGATLALNGDVLNGNTAVIGGAVEDEGTLTMLGTTFTNNTTPGDGGAIDEDANGALSVGATIQNSFFEGNAAGQAGGAVNIQSAVTSAGPKISMEVTGSTFTSNVAGTNGGGLANASGNVVPSLVVSNSTFEGNRAVLAGGGVDLAIGLGSANAFDSDTLYANATGPNGEGGDLGVGSGVWPVFAETIVAGGSSPGGADCSGPVTSVGYNLESANDCGFLAHPSGTDLVDAEPLLGPLQSNGGPTATMALDPGSPAIDAIPSGTLCPATDQRGVARPQGPGCDIGAYELAPPVLGTATASSVGTTSATLNAPVSNPDVQAGDVFFQVWTSASFTFNSTLQTLPAGLGATAFAVPLTGLTPGTVYSFRVVGQDPDGTVVGAANTFTTAGGAQPMPSPKPTPTPAPEGNTFTVGGVQLAPSGHLALSLGAPGAGAFSARATFRARTAIVTHRHHRRVIRHVTATYTYGTGTANSFAKGTVKLGVGLRGPAGRALKKVGHATVTISITFTPASGSPHRETTTVSVRWSRRGGYRAG